MLHLIPVLLSIAINASAVPQKPDLVKTPGAVFTSVTKKDICVTGYSKSARSVSMGKKKAVFALYEINPKSGRFEIDHLVPLELGGSNDAKNLWPQSYTSHPYNAHAKNRLENRLRKLVCSGSMSLRKAQSAIAKDWVKAYLKYVK